MDHSSFPRGSKKTLSNGLKRQNENESLYSAPQSKKVKKSQAPVVERNNLVHLTNENILTRHVFQEGMTVLACIRSITNYTLDVELPGLQAAKVTLDAISDFLKTALQGAIHSSDIPELSGILKNLFTPGQYVPCKLRSIQNNEDKNIILGSISPSDLYEGRRHNTFKKGEMLWASVKAESDHGYQLDCGIPNCRIFLPTQNVEVDMELKIGQPIWCKIHKVDTESAASTLRVGAKKLHIDSVLTDETVPLNSILPGTKVEVFIEKVLKHGLFCKFFDNHAGFIHESQLNPPMKNLKTIKEAKLMNAYVLYVDEITRITYLSLRSLDSDLQQTYIRGQKVSAMVIGRNPTGLYLKLNKNDRGWISNKRLITGSKKSSENKALIAEKYSNSSNHRCVVLSYNYMDRVYICGIDKDLINEKYFTFKDFTVGELVKGIVHDIKSSGIILKVGQVKGFIPNIHLTDSSYTDNLKKKYAIGNRVKARVFQVKDDNLILTLKSDFIKNDKCLSSLENVTINEVYPALVLKAKPYGLVLTFYNNVEGFVPLTMFNFSITQDYKVDPSSYFPSGQVINVRIVDTKKDKVIASLSLDGSSKTKVTKEKVTQRTIIDVQDNTSNASIKKKRIRKRKSAKHKEDESLKIQKVEKDVQSDISEPDELKSETNSDSEVHNTVEYSRKKHFLQEEDISREIQGTKNNEELDILDDVEVKSEANSESEVESPDENEIDSDEDSSIESNKDSGVYVKASKLNCTQKFEKLKQSGKVDSEQEGKTEVHSAKNKVLKSEDKKNGKPILPSISNFFSTQIKKELNESSSDDETEVVETKKKKKKLSPAERAEQARLEEDRISKIEKELAESANEPQSAEQFERILVAQPNSSILWMKYMSFYLALAEFEKARAVGKKALETINMTLEDEKLNIWIFLLNLENLYGTKESFEKMFEDAIRYNDSFKVYMKVLDMLHDSGKHAELEEKIKKAKTKFKQEPEMWLQVAKIYYLLGKYDEARNIKNACLRSITIAKLQYNLIIKFAILEFNHGEIDVGCTILDKVLETYPNKIGARLVYIDQLINKQQIEQARNLFLKAISMPLSLKSIKVICHKYRSFEEKHGTSATLELFKEKAKKILQEKVQAAL